MSIRVGWLWSGLVSVSFTWCGLAIQGRIVLVGICVAIVLGYAGVVASCNEVPCLLIGAHIMHVQCSCPPAAPFG